MCGCINNQENNHKSPRALYTYDTFDFKKIRKGAIVNASFRLKNTGNLNLLIKNTSAGCGCTKVGYVKDTIPPGEAIDIKLNYDSKDDSGKVLKTFVVETNTNPKLHVLFIKGIVE